jgi:hypothetical protein
MKIKIVNNCPDILRKEAALHHALGVRIAKDLEEKTGLDALLVNIKRPWFIDVMLGTFRDDKCRANLSILCVEVRRNSVGVWEYSNVSRRPLVGAFGALGQPPQEE